MQRVRDKEKSAIKQNYIQKWVMPVWRGANTKKLLLKTNITKKVFFEL